jgi:hypothetical protein
VSRESGKKEGIGMNATARKMTKVIDELIVFFISAGSDGVRMDLEKQQDGYELSLESNYDPAQRKKIDDLDRFFNNAQRNEGLEEFFWQLAGVSGLGQDTELHLIGQMVECRKLEIRDDSVSLVLYKARE